MRVEQRKDLKNISTIIIKDSEGRLEDIVQIHGSSSSLLGISDFAEYGLNFLPTKYKYNGKFPLELMSNKSRKLVGTELLGIEKVSKSFFPTVCEDNDKPGYSYFGTVEINSQILVMIDMPSGYDKVYVFDYSVTKFCSEWKTEFTLSETDEKTSRKLLWFILSPGGSVFDINLTKNAWSNSINPERNQNEYLLRNDELKKTVNLVEKISGTSIVVDRNSDTILGTGGVKSHPLLTRKLNNRPPYSEWLSEVDYSKGSIVRHNNIYYYALKNNRGSEPVDYKTQYSFPNELIWLKMHRDSNILYDPSKTYRSGSEVFYEGKSWLLMNTYTHGGGLLGGGTTYLLEQIDPLYPEPYAVRGWVVIPDSTYNPKHTYSKYSKCKFNGQYWVSLLDNNINNLPCLSAKYWTLEEKLNEYYEKKISVILTPDDGGKLEVRNFQVTEDLRRIKIKVDLKNYDIASIHTGKSKVGDLLEYRDGFKENNNRLINNPIVNIKRDILSGPSERPAYIENKQYTLSGSYYDGEIVIDLDLRTNAKSSRSLIDIEPDLSELRPPVGFKVSTDSTKDPTVLEKIIEDGGFINVALVESKRDVVINVRIDDTDPDNTYETDFYKHFKSPFTLSSSDDYYNHYYNIDPSVQSIGFLKVNSNPIDTVGKKLDPDSGNVVDDNDQLVAQVGKTFNFSLLVDKLKYDINGLTTFFFDPYKSTNLLPKMSTDMQCSYDEIKFKGIDYNKLEVTDIIDRKAYPIYTVNLNTKLYTFRIVSYEGFDISSNIESTKYGGTTKFTIASNKHKFPKIKILNSKTGETLTSDLLTPTKRRYYKEVNGRNILFAWIGSYLKSGKPGVDGSDYTGNLEIDEYGQVTENNLTGRHDIFIKFIHEPDQNFNLEADYIIEISYDN